MITDEMVEVACIAAADTIAQGYHARRDGPSKRCAEREMRAALTAVMPVIRDAVLEEAAKVAMNRDVGDGYYIAIREAIAEAILAISPREAVE